MKLWIDDVRPAPEGWVWLKSVNAAKRYIHYHSDGVIDYDGKPVATVDLISLDHDLGDYAYDGGDGVKLLDWLEETGRDYPIRIHSQNPVGVQNMRRIIQRNNWKEVY